MRKTKRVSRHRQRGVAAVELAIILPFLVTLLAMALFLGRVFWHYTAAQKAAYDAARFMSAIPLRDMTPERIGDALYVAQQILDAELGELNPGDYPVDTAIRCGTFTNCNGYVLPEMISVGVQMPIQDPVFGGLLETITGNNNIVITANVTMRYVGK